MVVGGTISSDGVISSSRDFLFTPELLATTLLSSDSFPLAFVGTVFDDDDTVIAPPSASFNATAAAKFCSVFICDAWMGEIAEMDDDDFLDNATGLPLSRSCCLAKIRAARPMTFALLAAAVSSMEFICGGGGGGALVFCFLLRAFISSRRFRSRSSFSCFILKTKSSIAPTSVKMIST